MIGLAAILKGGPGSGPRPGHGSRNIPAKQGLENVTRHVSMINFTDPARAREAVASIAGIHADIVDRFPAVGKIAKLDDLMLVDDAFLGSHERELNETFPSECTGCSTRTGLPDGSFTNSKIFISCGETLQWAKQENAEVGGNNTATTSAGSFVHELGHHYQSCMGAAFGRQWFRAATTVKLRTIEEKISGYATVSPRECFAEAFNIYTSKDYGENGRLPKQIERFFDNSVGVGKASKSVVKGGPGSGPRSGEGRFSSRGYHIMGKQFFEKYKDKINQWKKTVGEDSKIVLIGYQNHDHEYINRELRMGKAPSSDVKELDKATTFILPENVMIYRGVDDHVNIGGIGTTKQDKGFTSCTRDSNVLYPNNRARPYERVLSICVPKGTPVCIPQSLGIGGWRREKEIILPRGSKYVVRSKFGSDATLELISLRKGSTTDFEFADGDETKWGKLLESDKSSKSVIVGITKFFPTKKAATIDFNFEDWMFDGDEDWTAMLQDISGQFMKDMYDEFGNAAYDGLQLQLGEGAIAGAFNIDDPRVTDFIDKYTYQFAEGLGDTTVDLLKDAMTAGMEQGLSMDGISELISQVFDDETRADLIARTETIRASNYGALEGYKQSGVVNQKEWLCTEDDRLCEECSAMDGTVIDLDDNFQDEEDNDYEDVGAPPLHPNCRCTLIPVVDTSIFSDEELATMPEQDAAVVGIMKFFKGGPGSGPRPGASHSGGTEELYHGTHSGVVDKILKEGISPSDHRNWSRSYYTGRENKVFVTSNRSRAIGYAQQARKTNYDRAVIFKVEIPKGTKLLPDAKWKECFTLNKVPAKWIKSYEVIIGNRSRETLVREVTGDTYYVPLIIAGENKDDKQIGLSAIFKYSEDQPRDSSGRFGSGGGDKVNISTYPKDAKEITHEKRMAQATFSDIKSNMAKDLAQIEPKEFTPKSVSGTVADSRAAIIENAKGELGRYSHYLAGDTNNRARDFIDHMDNVLQSKDVAGMDAKQMDQMMRDSIGKLVYQEMESNRQQFTDHGIRHIVGDIMRADAILKAASDEKVSGMDRLMSAFILVNHDVGYTTPLIRDGGERGVAISHDHGEFSGKILGEQSAIFDESKGMFSKEEYDRMVEIAATHDATTIDKNDLLGTSVRLADNLSLFSSEKLPGMFQYVDGGKTYLASMGKAAAEKDTVAFEKQRSDLYSALDKSNMSEQLKRDLKASVAEISYLTPKYVLGALAGNISGISRTSDGKVNIGIKYNSWDAFLQRSFDMGQRQTQKLMKDYGETDFTKTSYSLGKFVTLNVTGYERDPHKIFEGLSAIFKYSEDQPRDWHGRFGDADKENAVKMGLLPIIRVNDKYVMADGKEMPRHIREDLTTPIPGGWHDVYINPDEKSCQAGVYGARGRDEADRAQRIYTKEYRGGQTEANFACVSELDKKIDAMEKENNVNLKSDSEKVRENAAILRLTMETAIRPGSEADNHAAKKAYGTTTLEGRHVVKASDGLRLIFTGKSGVEQNHLITDKTLVKDLVARAKDAGKNGQLFGTKYQSFLNYVKTLDGKDFTPKNFRTLVATRQALKEIRASKTMPKNMTQYKTAVLSVAKIVSQKLGNRPSECLKSYINPVVFGDWRKAAKV